MAGLDATLGVQNASGGISMTAQFERLEKAVEEHKPKLVVIDPAADVFGGDEIKRVQVRQFVQKLAKLALDNDCAVMLLAHPSLAGLTSGRGTSGSTAWSNSARARLYLETDADDPNRRLLKVMKANHGAIGEEIALRWHGGAFVLDQGGDPAAVSMVHRAADDVFLSVFLKLTGQGHRLSPKPCATYAPKRIETEGPPPRRYQMVVKTTN
jgi:RecA-family ATPase